MKYRWFLAMVLMVSLATSAFADIVDFEDLGLTPGTYYNGDPGHNTVGVYGGAFTSGGVSFANRYEIEATQFGLYKHWDGFGYSNTKDVTTPGVNGSGVVVNDMSAYVLPVDNSTHNTYGVVFGEAPGMAVVELPTGAKFQSMDVTNTTYAAISMLEGDGFSVPFGAGDWFLLQVIGWDENNQAVASPIDFYLADYRGIGGAENYLVSDWTTIDLQSLSDAKKLTFALTSSDVSDYGGGLVFMNTPAYFAMDNLTFEAVPEPATGVLLLMGTGIFLRLRRRFGK